MDGEIYEFVSGGDFRALANDIKVAVEDKSITSKWLVAGVILLVMLFQHLLLGGSPVLAGESAPIYMAVSPATPSTADPFVVKCSEPIPEFSLGRNSHPTKTQVQQLCGCIWNRMNKWERETSRAIVEGREREVSYIHMRAFPSRFGQRVKECGGYGL